MYLTMNTLYGALAFIIFSLVIFWMTKLICYGCEKTSKQEAPKPDGEKKMMDTPNSD